MALYTSAILNLCNVFAILYCACGIVFSVDRDFHKGLYCDEWRRSLPDATKYRPFVKNAFADVMGLPEHGHYTPAAAELRSGLRTGQALVLNFTVPCPLLERRDCYGVWLAWGECGPSGQSMRYTVEYTALAGGAACPWRDGHVAMQKCS